MRFSRGPAPNSCKRRANCPIFGLSNFGVGRRVHHITGVDLGPDRHRRSRYMAENGAMSSYSFTCIKPYSPRRMHCAASRSRRGSRNRSGFGKSAPDRPVPARDPAAPRESGVAFWITPPPLCRRGGGGNAGGFGKELADRNRVGGVVRIPDRSPSARRQDRGSPAVTCTPPVPPAIRHRHFAAGERQPDSREIAIALRIARRIIRFCLFVEIGEIIGRGVPFGGLPASTASLVASANSLRNFRSKPSSD